MTSEQCSKNAVIQYTSWFVWWLVLILRNWAVYIIPLVKHPTRASFDHCSMLSFHQPEIAETGGMRNFLHHKNRAILPTPKILVVVTSDWILELKLKKEKTPNQNRSISNSYESNMNNIHIPVLRTFLHFPTYSKQYFSFSMFFVTKLLGKFHFCGWRSPEL